MSKKHYTANEVRSIVKNPITAAYAADRNNRIQQGHSNIPPPPPPPPKPDPK